MHDNFKNFATGLLCGAVMFVPAVVVIIIKSGALQ